MLDSESIGTRFTVSAVSNVARAVLAFATGVLLARGLDPVGYGELTFLLGTFVAIRSLMDLGSGNAFYTFLSRKRRHRTFHLYYIAWLVVQFAAVCLLVAVILPNAVIDRIWLGHDRGMILLALGAAFAQQQVWQTFVQIGEARRKTVRVQIIGVLVALAHLIVIAALLATRMLSVPATFSVLIAEYLIAAVAGGFFLRNGDREEVEPPLPPRELLRMYWHYCRPLVALSLFGFLYDFADRWLLQRFAGARQQGLFQIASQFAAISLVATTSLLNIFWKEIAAARERGDHEAVAAIYRRVNKAMVMFGAILSGLLIPWSEQIVRLSLGPAYVPAAPVLMIMLLYPIHQAMGQIGGTFLLATGDTRTLMRLTIAAEVISIVAAYLLLAPRDALVPGLALGAAGLAGKQVALNIATVNAQAWMIARHNAWRFEWSFQVIGISVALALGFASKALVTTWLPGEGMISTVAPSFLLTAFLYTGAMAALFWNVPALAGFDRDALGRFMGRRR